MRTVMYTYMLGTTSRYRQILHLTEQSQDPKFAWTKSQLRFTQQTTHFSRKKGNKIEKEKRVESSRRGYRYPVNSYLIVNKMAPSIATTFQADDGEKIY